MSPSPPSGSYTDPNPAIDTAVEASYGTIPSATAVQARHMTSGTDDPRSIARRTFPSSPRRDATSGTTSLYISSWMNTGTAHGRDDGRSDRKSALTSPPGLHPHAPAVTMSPAKDPTIADVSAALTASILRPRQPMQRAAIDDANRHVEVRRPRDGIAVPSIVPAFDSCATSVVVVSVRKRRPPRRPAVPPKHSRINDERDIPPPPTSSTPTTPPPLL